jgi:cytidylate kinase
MSKGDVLVCSASVDQAISYMRILEKARICDVYFIILECSAAERIKRVLDRDSSDKAVLELCRRILDEREEFNKIYDLGLENKKYITINTGNGIEISSCADIINDFISSKIS